MKKVLAIIYKIEKKQRRFLILHRKLRWTGWECMKETMEENESEEETLRRGINEEIGVERGDIKKHIPINIKLTDGSAIEKAFLVKIDAKEKIDIIKNKSKEHDAYKWVSQKEAQKLLAYKNIVKVMNKLVRG
ncbi:MAG TPA: NUDIX domain-containing protein [Candidatus Nanoarchaeia archaeon]|nr:NUDIX domain-containing protein [Candidatus Nanoarchaeia archaeon]